jgi:hypothetical protein
MSDILRALNETRFVFGTHTATDLSTIFVGVVVSGVGITYDPETGRPDGGTISRIDY